MNLKECLLQLIFPQRCIFCDEIAPYSHFICDSCLKNYPLKRENICKRCGKLKESCICQNLSADTYKILSACKYEKAAITAIKRFKSDTETDISEDFAKLLLNVINNSKEKEIFSYVTYVPMEKEKEIVRGHNMAKTLAQKFSSLSGIELLNPPIEKRYSEKFQHQLNYKDRFKNASQTFFASGGQINGNIILIDDVVTTGATLDTVCHLLKLSGANKVLCLTVASTQLNHNER